MQPWQESAPDTRPRRIISAVTTTKRWSSKEWRDELTAKFVHLLADEEGISLREARRDLKGLSRDQLRDIYDLAENRIAGSGRARVGFAEVVEEVAVEDLLPTLAANASKAREEQKKRLG